MPKPAHVRALTGLCLAWIVGCDKTPTEPTPVSSASFAASAPQPGHAAAPKKELSKSEAHPSTTPGITWEDPSGWKRLPQNSPMRVATYRVPGKNTKADEAELAVFYFGPNSGGGVEPNIERWRKQFSDVPDEKVRRSERSRNSLRQHIVEIERGTYSTGMSMGPQTPQKDQGLLAAIVETPTGHYFFKLTGPAETVKEARGAFMELLDSVKAKEP